MKYIISLLICLSVTSTGVAQISTQVKAYLITNNISLESVSFSGYGENNITIVDPSDTNAYIAAWNVAELSQPEISELPSVEDAVVIIENNRQASKSDLHKAADNALITVLIRGGFVASNTTSLVAGTADSVSASLLASEVADPTNLVIQGLSSKLDRIRGVIEHEGGYSDDAIIHE